MGAEGVRAPERGRKKAAGALYRRIRHREVGCVEDRPAVDLHDRVAKLDELLLLVVVDLASLQLPYRWRAWVVPAEVAGGVYSPLQLGAVPVGAARGIGRQSRAVIEQHPHILCERVIHRIAQLDEIGKDDLSGRLRKADIAGGGNGVRPLVVRDGIGEKYLSALGNLDVAARNRQRELVVVLDLVGAEDDRRVSILGRPAADRNLGPGGAKGADNDQGRHQEAPKPPRSAPHATAALPMHVQPSSKWSSIETPKIRLTPVGTQAASATGSLAERPRAKTTSDRK